MSLKYELSVRNFICPECGEFSDEISKVSADIMDETIVAMCCDTEFWRYDLEVEGFDVIEVIHA